MPLWCHWPFFPWYGTASPDFQVSKQFAQSDPNPIIRTYLHINTAMLHLINYKKNASFKKKKIYKKNANECLKKSNLYSKNFVTICLLNLVDIWFRSDELLSVNRGLDEYGYNEIWVSWINQNSIDLIIEHLHVLHVYITTN